MGESYRKFVFLNRYSCIRVTRGKSEEFTMHLFWIGIGIIFPGLSPGNDSKPDRNRSPPILKIKYFSVIWQKRPKCSAGFTSEGCQKNRREIGFLVGYWKIAPDANRFFEFFLLEHSWTAEGSAGRFSRKAPDTRSGMDPSPPA